MLTRKPTVPNCNSLWDNRKSACEARRVEILDHTFDSMAQDELACCSNANIFKSPAMSEKSGVLKRNCIRNQACTLKLLTADESSFSDMMTELRPISDSSNHSSSISNSYGAETSQSSSTALRKAYTNQFAVRITGGDILEADKLATKHGFINLGPVLPNDEYFLFESRQTRKRSTRPRRNAQTNSIAREPKVSAQCLQTEKQFLDESSGFSSRILDVTYSYLYLRVYMYVMRDAADTANISSLFPVIRSWHPTSKYYTVRGESTCLSSGTEDENIEDHALLVPVEWIEQQIAKKRVKRGYMSVNSRSPTVHLQSFKGNEISDDLTIIASSDAQQQYSSSRNRNAGARSAGNYNLNDPLWSHMWYLNPAVYGRGLDHNVREAWDLGYTGRGVVVTILDDGLERTHPDIAPNYDAKASYDVNDRDEDPTPRYDYTDENRHGTRCAGEVAAIFNNSLCIVGIAYNARIGGIRMLDGDVTDAVEATSLAHNSDHIDIYSASWGPDDDGRTVDGPAKLTRRAFEKGIREGRRGLGSIFVWASGNGGKDADSCNCDGYTNSIYTLSISSATEHGNIPWYSEACSSTLATAYSSGATGEKMIVTTDLHHSCTNAHTGTSASAPLAAGIAALTLEANPKLTWRDMQHIVVRTARPLNLRAGDWVTNGVGKKVSHSFGFGLMDAGAMVRLASNWTRVPEQRKCVVFYPARYKTVPHGNRLQLQLYTDGCASYPRNKVGYLEHVQAIITLTAPKRGDIQIYLTSPSGTRSTLLAKRARDTSRTGFREWAFMTTHNWGEMAVGLWTLEINNDGWDDAELIRWDLVLYGTAAEVSNIGGTSLTSSSLTLRSLSSKTRTRYGALWDDISAAPIIIASSNIALFPFLFNFIVFYLFMPSIR
uniref:P/Homo B domain-containing protein n=1 Tax=Loa loa TaxID=7209 RepID=A0A1I7VVC2_LOALO